MVGLVFDCASPPNTRCTRRSNAPLFSIASKVLAKVGGASLLAIASTSASSCFIPSSMAG